MEPALWLVILVVVHFVGIVVYFFEKYSPFAWGRIPMLGYKIKFSLVRIIHAMRRFISRFRFIKFNGKHDYFPTERDDIGSNQVHIARIRLNEAKSKNKEAKKTALSRQKKPLDLENSIWFAWGVILNTGAGEGVLLTSK